MTTDRTSDVTEIEAVARSAGLGELQGRHGTGGRGAAVVGIVLIAAGVALAVLCLLGRAGEVMPVVGIVGMLLGVLIVDVARRARNTLKQFLLAFALAALVAAPGFISFQLEPDSWAMVVVGLVTAAAFVALGALLLRRPQPGRQPTEVIGLFEGGIVYAGSDLDDGRPTAFPWASTTIEESLTPVGHRLHHTLTFRRHDGYWLRRTFDPVRRFDARLIRRVHDVMAAQRVGPLVDSMRAGETVELGGGLRGTAAGLATVALDGSPDHTDALAWHDIRGVGFSETSYVVRGRRNRMLQIPLAQARDVGVLQAVIAAMSRAGA